MMNPKLFGIMLLVISSVIAVTIIHSQSAMASAYSGQTGGSTRSGMADLDLEEAVEAENATMAGTTNQTTTNGSTTEFLAIQNAQSGSISEINATAYTLELSNVSDETILFSDRPERIVETVSTADFIGNWSTGPNSFESDAPNDVLIVEDNQTGDLETAVIELFNPVYDPTANRLTYTITAENATSIELPREFGQALLVIDNAVTWDPRGEFARGE